MKRTKFSTLSMTVILAFIGVCTQIAFSYPVDASDTGDDYSYYSVDTADETQLDAPGEYYAQNDTPDVYEGPQEAPSVETEPPSPGTEPDMQDVPEPPVTPTVPPATTPPPPAETVPEPTPPTPEVIPPDEVPPVTVTPTPMPAPQVPPAPPEQVPPIPPVPQVAPTPQQMPPAVSIQPAMPATVGRAGTAAGVRTLPRTGAHTLSILVLSFSLVAAGTWLRRKRA